eukprot:CAMPEP_0202491620 /NCGR_PEP_ID=MMETSP1361-20130828/8618_1 /ASSEMBLY_ACC=CAM_ASM_000849 /TAXON_ID=210615 /ORGANISM="Staurosira complex sp., Strain CCMP2646" /LENGTH=527 /DNA_ID=CAMNT_0049121701 /DNA_START=132 /DNA_END=1715 /DNA_ORIENTATION=-
MVGSSSSSSSWRNPSAENQQKYNLVELPESFVPTKEEEDLLQAYESLRNYEKEAARVKEQAAKAKLATADLKYKQSIATEEVNEDVIEPIEQKVKAKKRKKRPVGAPHEGDNHDENISDEYESEHEEQSRHEKREAKLAEMREELEEAKQTKEAAEEAMRAQLLQEQEAADIESGPSLKRKKMEEPLDKSALLAHLDKHTTPPHEFSKDLEIKSWEGKVLFPDSPNVSSWSPQSNASHPNEGALTLELPDFDISQAHHGQGNNTLAIKFTSPTDAKRFSLNIAGPDHADFYSVLFHFNPRALERGGQVVMNDKKEGNWGQGLNIPLSQLPLIFGQEACTLVIQINGNGFDVFLEGEHCARLQHRQPLPDGKCSLYLQFPSTDDYGSPESWTVYRVWWGNKKPMAKADPSGVPGVAAKHLLHPRKLFISGLSRIATQAEVDERRAELERAFRKYGGNHGAIAIVPKDKAYAFIELDTERQADLALQEMQDKYRLNRARLSRHEALQEERAAAEAAANDGQKKESSDWD